VLALAAPAPTLAAAPAPAAAAAPAKAPPPPFRAETVVPIAPPPSPRFTALPHPREVVPMAPLVPLPLPPVPGFQALPVPPEQSLKAIAAPPVLSGASASASTPSVAPAPVPVQASTAPAVLPAPAPPLPSAAVSSAAPASVSRPVLRPEPAAPLAALGDPATTLAALDPARLGGRVLEGAAGAGEGALGGGFGPAPLSGPLTLAMVPGIESLPDDPAIEAAIGAALAFLGRSDTARLELRSYASVSADDPISARRLSLGRGLALRERLVAAGIRPTRVAVRALGDAATVSPQDRIDLIPFP